MKAKGPISREDYRAFQGFLEQASGIVLGDNKEYLVASRLSGLLREHGLSGLGDLLKRLRNGSDRRLRIAVVDAMTTNETFWFRDVSHYRLLAERIFPQAAAKGRRPVRIWSAACSSGQEPYSISMTVQEFIGRNPGRLPGEVEIVATDLSTKIMAEARRGVYCGMAVSRGLEAEQRRRFFLPRGDCPAFLPWHREFLLRFENELVRHGSTIGLPYWDWTDHTGTSNKLFVDEFLGARDGLIMTGYFAFDAPGTPGTPNSDFSKPHWWPDNLVGWRIRPSLAHTFGTTLLRKLDSRSLAIPEDIRRTMSRPIYEDSATAIEVDPIRGTPDDQPRGFRNRLERGRRMHGFGHGWVGGHMGHPLTSPNDLIFFLHHCNIDRLWAEWQSNGHQGAPFYPGPQSGEDEGHKLNDAMWPWVGSSTGYVPTFLPSDSPIPDFTAESERTPADLLDHQTLGYVYL